MEGLRNIIWVRSSRSSIMLRYLEALVYIFVK
jgi:hypothetical protein